jgi:hypothetical protein
MNRINSARLIASALFFGVLLAEVAAGQTGSTVKNQLIGTWILVSNYTEREDGTKFDTFGPNPIGIIKLDGDGRVFLQEMRSDLPKFASSNRQEGTAEENKAIVQGSISYFGTYTVDESAKTLTFHIQGCSFPNWTGTDQKRSFTTKGDEMTWNAASGSSGKPIRAVWKRAE